MKTEELAQWVEVQVTLGEYSENDPDLLPMVAERLRELEAEVELLNQKLEVIDLWSSIPTEEHTLRKERGAVAKYIRSIKIVYGGKIAKLLEMLAFDIEHGEHWPEGGTP